MKFRTRFRNLAVIVLAMVAAAAAHAADGGANSLEGNPGELILARIPTAPFPHPNRSAGHKYHEEFFSGEQNYQDNTVGIFIPQYFQPGETVDVVVHFHGWRNNVTNVLRQYRLIDQFAASGKNAILVVPQGPLNAADSFGGKLEDADGFKLFIDDVLVAARKTDSLGKWKVGKIILSAHSGGYQVVSSILDRGGLASPVQEVWLFDGLYGQTEKFRSWMEKANGRFIDVYTAHGGTKAETEKLMDELKQQGTPFLATDESAITADQLRENRLQFIFAKLPHDAVLHQHKTFLQFLKTSCLSVTLPGPGSNLNSK